MDPARDRSRANNRRRGHTARPAADGAAGRAAAAVNAKAAHRPRRRKRAALRGPGLLWLGFALILLALITTVSLARYYTARSEKETASLMQSDIALISFDASSIKEPGDSAKLLFDVVNYTVQDETVTVSAVSQQYSICVNQTSELPLKYVLKCTSVGTPAKGVGLGRTSELKPGEELLLGTMPLDSQAKHSYELTVSWPKGSRLKPSLINSGELDAAITLSIKSEQTVEQRSSARK